MSQVNPTNKPFLSKRQRRMLQDMGIDVFTMRTAAADSAPAHAEVMPTSPSQSPAAAARAALAQAQTAAQTEEAQTTAAPPAQEQGDNQQRAMPLSDAPAAAPVRIDLSFVATPALIYVGETELSALELRFVHDVASAAHWVVKRTPLKSTVRNSEFRWPIVEATGTPERAVTVFCEKHGLFSPGTAVLVSRGAAGVLKPWLSESTEHWLEVDALAQTLAQGDAKRELWQRVIERLVSVREP